MNTMDWSRFTGPEFWLIVKAIAIFAGGWIIAVIISASVRALLQRTKLDNRIAAWIQGDEKKPKIAVEAIVSKVVFYLVMLFVAVAVLQTLGLTIVTEPLNLVLGRVMEYLPRLASAGLLVLVAWLVATVLRAAVTRGLQAIDLDRRLFPDEARAEGARPLSATIGESIYWLVFLLFLPGILGALSLQGMLEPVQEMVTKLVDYLPNLFAGVMTLLIGWLLARIVQRIVASFTAAVGVDSFAARVGIDSAFGSQRTSSVLGGIVYVLILIPVLISALTALQLDSVTGPLTNMLNELLSAVPNLFAAALLLFVAWVIAKIVSQLVTTVLRGLGFDNLLARLGLKTPEPEAAPAKQSERSPSAVAGSVATVFIMLFAATEAAGLLGFESLEALIDELLIAGGHIFFGLVVFGVGLLLANFAATAVRRSGAPNAGFLSTIARIAVLLLTGAMALRQMGIANEIINLAFGLTLGAVAVAAAVAFGFGGREVAGRKLAEWVAQLESGNRRAGHATGD